MLTKEQRNSGVELQDLPGYQRALKDNQSEKNSWLRELSPEQFLHMAKEQTKVRLDGEARRLKERRNMFDESHQ